MKTMHNGFNQYLIKLKQEQPDKYKQLRDKFYVKQTNQAITSQDQTIKK